MWIRPHLVSAEDGRLGGRLLRGLQRLLLSTCIQDCRARKWSQNAALRVSLRSGRVERLESGSAAPNQIRSLGLNLIRVANQIHALCLRAPEKLVNLVHTPNQVRSSCESGSVPARSSEGELP